MLAFVFAVFRLFMVLLAVPAALLVDAVDFFDFRLLLPEAVVAVADATDFGSILLFIAMQSLLLFMNVLFVATDCIVVLLMIVSNSVASQSISFELRMLVSVLMYFMAMRSVVIFVNFSLLLFELLSQNDTGTHCRRCSNALFISRIRIRSRAFAVFRRYLLNGAAFCLDFGFAALFLLLLFDCCADGCGADDAD